MTESGPERTERDRTLQPFKSVSEIDETIARSQLHVLYISEAACSVGGAVWPKVEALLEEFPQAEVTYVQIDDLPELAGHYSVFTVPVIIIYFEGKEVFRQARILQLDTIEQTLSRMVSFID